MRENMTFLTNYYQIREMTIIVWKKSLIKIKGQRKEEPVFFGDSITQFMDIEKIFSRNKE